MDADAGRAEAIAPTGAVVVRRLRRPARRPGRRHRPHRDAAVPAWPDGAPRRRAREARLRREAAGDDARGCARGASTRREQPASSSRSTTSCAITRCTGWRSTLTRSGVLGRPPALRPRELRVVGEPAAGPLVLGSGGERRDPRGARGPFLRPVPRAGRSASPIPSPGRAQRRADGRTDRVCALLRLATRRRPPSTTLQSHGRDGADDDPARVRARTRDDRGLDPDEPRDGWPRGARRDEHPSRPVRRALRETDSGTPSGRRLVGVQALKEAPDRQNEYRAAIRAGITDLIAAIEGVRPLQVGSNAVRSLEIALRAS